MRKQLCALIGMFASGAALASPPFVHDLDRRFDQYTWVTSHNAFNQGLSPVPNQSLSTRHQLDLGVRGLMLDVHDKGGQVRLCHSDKFCFGFEKTLVEELRGTIVPFLQANPQAVVSIHLEDYTSRSALGAALAQVPALAALSFNPDTWATPEWPTIRQMIARGQRLLIFNAKNANTGNFPVGNGSVHIMRNDQTTVENTWSIGATIGIHNYSCQSRWSSIPLTASRVSLPGKTWARLFSLNHFHGVSEPLHSRTDNRFDKLQDRVDNYCGPASGKLPNFLGLDHVHQGDAFAYAGVLNQGGIIFYEGNGGSQDVVCGVPGQTHQSINFKDNSLGCENDEARSAVLVNMKKGTRFFVYDSPSGSRGDDWAMVEVLRDFAGPVMVGSFERNWSSSNIRIEAHYKNGLDGKISRLEVVPPLRLIIRPILTGEEEAASSVNADN